MISLTRGPKLGRACFFPYGAQFPTSEDGERAERLTSTLFGAEDGGRHHQGHALALTSLRRTSRRCAFERFFPPLGTSGGGLQC